MNDFNIKFIIIVSFLISFSGYSQSYEEEIKNYQIGQNKEFKDPDHSPLEKDSIENFKELYFFEIDKKYKVKAIFIKNKGKKFEMKTSTDRLPIYQRVGYLEFSIDNELQQLSVFKNIGLSKEKEYKNYLFIPFKDFTNGVETYGGGRYLDIIKPEKGMGWILDFNKCYNPYCAYSYKYSCPIPPEENHLEIEIKAGVKKYH